MKKSEQIAFEIYHSKLAKQIPIRVKNNEKFTCNSNGPCENDDFSIYIIDSDKHVYVVGECKRCGCVHVFADNYSNNVKYIKG